MHPGPVVLLNHAPQSPDERLGAHRRNGSAAWKKLNVARRHGAVAWELP